MFHLYTVGSVIACKYPIHGSRNILKQRRGKVVATGIGPHGPYLTIKVGSKKYRSLRYDRIVEAVEIE